MGKPKKKDLPSKIDSKTGPYNNSSASRAKVKKSPISKPNASLKERLKKYQQNSNDTLDSVIITTNDDSARVPASFYERPCVDLAKALLGQRLVRHLDGGERISGMIVETEAYIGYEDKAAHSYQGKRTAKNEAMFMPPGTAYVYHIYGMYRCLNISSQGEGHAVLIRGLEPLSGGERMRNLRGKKRKGGGDALKIHQLCNGPSKLCDALDIEKDGINKSDMIMSSALWLEKGEAVDSKEIVASARIGVNYAGDWATKPLRFYIRGNKSVSVRDKAAEQK